MTQSTALAPPTIEHDRRRIRALFGDHEVADSTEALVVREAGRRPEWYFPRHDVDMMILGQTQHQTVSPSKGRVTYFATYRDAHVVENAAWSFESPPAAFHAIAGFIAFQPVQFEFQSEGHTAADWDLDSANAPSAARG